jgi:hypothetical protein
MEKPARTRPEEFTMQSSEVFSGVDQSGTFQGHRQGLFGRGSIVEKQGEVHSRVQPGVEPRLFFGGLLLGGLLSAACGFDLFSPEAARREALLAEKEARQRSEAALEIEQARARELSRKLARLEEESEALSREHALAVEAAAALARAASVLGRELAEKSERLEAVDSHAARLERELSEARREASRLLAELDLQALRFFSRPRPADDVDLAGECLLRDGALAEKREVVVNLRRYSPDLLLSLRSRPAERPGRLAPGVSPGAYEVGRGSEPLPSIAPASPHRGHLPETP